MDRWDVVIVGAGTAGLTAAIFGARQGLKILVLDAAPKMGGTLHLSTGQMSAAGTKLQAELGIDDNPDFHFDDVMRISGGTADPSIVRLAVDNAGPTFDWLMDNGFDLHDGYPVEGIAHEPYTRRRYYWGKRDGISILDVVLAEIEPLIASGGVTVKLETEVVELLQAASGAVEGVLARTVGGEPAQYHGRRVLLACGGYSSNPALFEELCGFRQYANAAYEYSQGAGIGLATAVGGYVRGKENYISSFGSIQENDEFPARGYARFITSPAIRQPWEVYLNADGERFVREDEPSVDAREHALLGQPELRYWIVFDQHILDEAPVGVEDWSRQELKKHFGRHPMFFTGPDPGRLAEACGLPGESVVESIERYNASVVSGQDEFGRTHSPCQVSEPPYYAIRMQGTSISSTVGIAVDRKLRVIRPDGRPVANLYAVGELLGAGQLMGQAFCGGMMVMPALSLGRKLGAEAFGLK